MKDLRSRWNGLVVLLALGITAGSVRLEARPQVSGSGSLVASVPTMNFGTVAVGSTVQQANYFFNPTGSYVIIGKAITSGSYYRPVTPLPVTIPPHQRAKFVFSFVPNRTGSLPGAITIWSRTRQSLSSAVSVERATLVIRVGGVGSKAGSTGGTLGRLVAAPGSLNFGSFASGAAGQSKPLSVTNSGTVDVTITQAAASGANFTLSAPGMPLILKAGAAANFRVTFAPKTAGSATGSVTIHSNAANPTLNVGLAASVTGAGRLTVSSSLLAFGSVKVGITQKQSATVTNSGGASVTLNQATVTGTGFSVSGMTMPTTLAPNQSTSISISCTPKAAGALSGSLTISSNATNPTVAVPLSATAVASVTPGSLTASAASLSFGSVQMGSSKTLPETVTNSGGSSVTLTQAAAGAGFKVTGLTLPLTLAAGQSAAFNVAFAPTTTGSSAVNLAIVNNSATPTLTIPLSGSGAAAGSLTASSVSFGSVPVGNSTTHTATLTNSGGSTVTVSQAKLTGSEFAMSGLTVPLTLNAGQTFTFSVTFSPQSTGAASGSIALVSTAGGASPSIALSGTGGAAGQFSVNPGSLAFGSVTVGATKTMPVTLGATGSSVTLTAASVNSPEFVLTGPSLPLTIQPGTSVSFALAFTPQSSGAATANVSFATSASSTPVSKAISGTGAAAAAQHSVDLAWSASSSSAVSGYNIYRGAKTGGPYAKVTSSPENALSYTDTSVQAGQTYFYTTTAVATDGSESAYSNEVKAVIPTP